MCSKEQFKQKVEEVLERNALLNSHGLGRSEGMPKFKTDGCGKMMMAEISKAREPLLTESGIDDIRIAYDWIVTHLRKAARINQKHTSYGLKHVMERYNQHYVTNGAFIVAMLIAGYNMNYLSLNPCFNVTTESVRCANSEAGKRELLHIREVRAERMANVQAVEVQG
jgi:hypothetical protein